VATARRYEDLNVWRLSAELRREVCAIVATGPAAVDFKFCHQLRDAAASAPRNIAEGFARYRPREFARFLEIARGSLAEVDDHLLDGKERGYFTPETTERLRLLAGRASMAALRLIQYLKTQQRH
jgi:four helix bundle protein